MLIGATSINIGDYSKSIQIYLVSEQEIIYNFEQPDLNLKLASVYLNIAICYIYLNNYNLAERYIKEGLNQTKGMLGNEIIYKVIFKLKKVISRFK